MKFTTTTKIARNKKTIFKEVGNTVYILDTTNTTIHTLNETASFIWKLAQKPVDLDTIVERVCEEFNVDRAKALNDIKEFVNKYIQQRYLKIT